MTDEALCRVERLERSYLWWKRIGVTATAAAGALLILTTHAYSQRKPGENRLDAPPPDAAAATPTDDKSMTTYYANFFRVTGTPEELLLDFGVNTQQKTANGVEPVKLSNRVVLNFYTAKRLLGALQWAITRYESNFGVIETDYKKRMQAGGAADKPER